LTESYSIVKDNGDSKEYKTFFIINEEAARQVRLRAMEHALKEMEITGRSAEVISEFANERLKLD